MTEARNTFDGPRPAGAKTALLTSTPSDAHTWNLVFLQLMLEESGYVVRNLGACSPIAALVRECREGRPDLVVVSSVNGHGRTEGAELISALRNEPDLREVPVVIGGMLTTGGADPNEISAELTAIGYSGVFIGERALPDFKIYLRVRFSGVAANVG